MCKKYSRIRRKKYLGLTTSDSIFYLFLFSIIFTSTLFFSWKSLSQEVTKGFVQSDFKPNNAFRQGLEVATEINRHIKQVEDEKLISRINDIGYRVTYWASDPGIIYSFNLIKVKEPNAFALPGGFIFITEGILKIDLNDDELAMLLGHEAAHVKNRHHIKLQRRAGLLTLLQQLFIVGAIVGMKDSSYRPVRDPRRNPEYSNTGKSAVVNGLLTFGTLFKNLLNLSFSRKMEHQADHYGFHYAVQAGYNPAAMLSLMQKLHDRIFELPGINYWRTHPYFSERIKWAKAKSKVKWKKKEKLSQSEFRQQSQNDFLRADGYVNISSSHYLEKKDYLENLAFRANPTGKYADLILMDTVTSKKLAIEKQPSMKRNYGKLIKRYKHVEELLAISHPSGTRLKKVIAARKKLEIDCNKLLPRYEQLLDRKSIGIPLLENFRSNYPKHKRILEVLTRLGRNYRLGGNIKKAAKILLQAHSLKGDEKWKKQAEDELRLSYNQIKSPSMLMEVMEVASESDKEKLNLKMEEIIKEDLTLEKISDFLNKWPQSQFTEKIEKQLIKIAERKYSLGRILEASKEYQKALRNYNNLITNAIKTDYGKLAKQRIEIINNLQENK